MRLDVDILALQDTKLAVVPPERARAAARSQFLHFAPGHAVRPGTTRSVQGFSCGVGFLMKAGVAVAVATPKGPAWRRLHEQGRIHAVFLGRRPGLPDGLLVFTVYAPVPEATAKKAAFVVYMLELVRSLDMQVPTLLLGDFNGSVIPERDYC